MKDDARKNKGDEGIRHPEMKILCKDEDPTRGLCSTEWLRGNTTHLNCQEYTSKRVTKIPSSSVVALLLSPDYRGDSHRAGLINILGIMRTQRNRPVVVFKH